MRTDTHVLVTLMGCTCVFLGCLYYFSGIYGGQLLKVHVLIYIYDKNELTYMTFNLSFSVINKVLSSVWLFNV